MFMQNSGFAVMQQTNNKLISLTSKTLRESKLPTQELRTHFHQLDIVFTRLHYFGVRLIEETMRCDANIRRVLILDKLQLTSLQGLESFTTIQKRLGHAYEFAHSLRCYRRLPRELQNDIHCNLTEDGMLIVYLPRPDTVVSLITS